MKRPNIILLFLMILACCASRHKEKEFDKTDPVVSEVTPTVSTYQATFAHGQSCTVHANLANGYSFQKWTVDGNNQNVTLSGSGNTRTFTMPDSPVEVSAPFQAIEYTIQVSASPTNGGSVYVGNVPGTTHQNFNYGDPCTVHATPNNANGFIFENWTENGEVVSTQAEYRFEVQKERHLVAHFAQQHTVTVLALPEEGGNPYIGNTFGTTQATFTHGQSCTVHANLANGYSFLKWTVNGNQVSTNANFTFTVNDDCTLVANYQPLPFTISVSADPSNGGTVTGDGGYHYGENCTLRATANSGFAFENWTEGDEIVSTYAEYQFTVTCSRTLVAHFTALPPDTYSINVSANPTNCGSPYIGSTPGTTQATFTHGQSCTVHANPANGYEFANWTVNGSQVSTNANYAFTVTSNRTLVAHFTPQAPNTYTITATADPANGGSVIGGGTYVQGATCTLTATPNTNTGYEFVNWTKNGQQVSTNPTYSFPVTESAAYVAHFRLKSFTINVSADPSNGGTVSGGGTYDFGQSCTLSATPNTGYTFINWTENGIVVSTNDTYTFIVEHDRNLIANFTSEQQHTITATANPEEGGTVTGGGTYASGVTCKLKATPNTGYTFINWTENGTAVSSNATYTFTVTNERNLIANFEKDEVPCIDNDNIQKIVPKYHTEDNETYTLILVYPNPDEEYVYQWCYAPETDTLHYRDLNVYDGTYNKQYFYRGGPLLKGYYKVRISKEKGGCSPVETEPYHVTYKRATQLRIYPNPSRRDHNIVVVNDSDGPSQLSIYSTDGQLLHAQTVTDNQTTINLNLPSGVYIAYLTDSEGCTKVGKLIIQ